MTIPSKKVEFKSSNEINRRAYEYFKIRLIDRFWPIEVLRGSINPFLQLFTLRPIYKSRSKWETRRENAYQADKKASGY